MGDSCPLATSSVSRGVPEDVPIRQCRAQRERRGGTVGDSCPLATSSVSRGVPEDVPIRQCRAQRKDEAVPWGFVPARDEQRESRRA